MMKLSLIALLALGTVRADYPFAFKDVGDAAGIFPHAAGIRGHAAAWGDVDGDGWPDLFIGTFHNQGSKPAMLLRNDKGKFRLDDQLQISGIGSGALFMDLTNSGRLDLYVSHCAHGKDGVLALPSQLHRNDGGGKFSDVSKDSGACPPGYSGRGLAALDYDGDGLLDFVTCEQYYSSKVKTGAALYRNLGNYKFENVSEKAGLPVAFGGLGVAVADVNSDGWPDIFLTHGGGEHKLLLNDKGKFREAPSEVFRWKVASADDTPAGVAIADVNRDGLPDIVIGHHFKSPWTAPASIRLYFNRGDKGFVDVTEAVGLQPLAMKAPHVEIQDFDNDGWPDISTSIVKFDGENPCPVIFKSIGIRDGRSFRDKAWAVNDFPTAEDKALKRSGPLFDKILKEKKIIYMAAGPSDDFDRDGKLDFFLANWWTESRSLLLRNETPGGHWLDVRVEGSDGVNRMGIGSRVNVSTGGKLMGSREISAGYGYCSGQEAIAHFGLGDEAVVDVEVVLPHGKGKIVRKGVKADQRITVKAAKDAEDIDGLTKAIETKPSAELYSRRGGEYFKLGKFKESIADFDRQIALDPKCEEDHWRRGISLYYAERFDDGAKQFELGKKVYGNDVENAFWHYLCLARAKTPAKAREKLLPIGADSRYYMPKVYELIAGRAKPEDLLAVIEKSTVKDKTEGFFYTHLYIGLNHEAEGNAEKSLEHLKLAAEKYPSTHYMGDVARVHIAVRKK